MNADLRKTFDDQLDRVMEAMPDQVHELLRKVPMYVDDYPSAEVLAKLGMRDRRHLCGLYSGIPLTQRSVQQSGVLSDAVHIFREGILELSRDAGGRIQESELRRQIRITILHELGHHHGMDEDELRQLGYG